MKKLLLLFLLMGSLAFSQEHSFQLHDRSVIWQKVFDGSADQIHHPKLKDGHVTKLSFRHCPGTSIFMRDDIHFDYKIESKENRFRVTISNISFENSFQFSSGYITTDAKSTNFEEFAVRHKKNELRDGFTHRKNYKCLEELFTRIFTPTEESAIYNDDW